MPLPVPGYLFSEIFGRVNSCAPDQGTPRYSRNTKTSSNTWPLKLSWHSKAASKLWRSKSFLRKIKAPMITPLFKITVMDTLFSNWYFYILWVWWCIALWAGAKFTPCCRPDAFATAPAGLKANSTSIAAKVNLRSSHEPDGRLQSLLSSLICKLCHGSSCAPWTASPAQFF